MGGGFGPEGRPVMAGGNGGPCCSLPARSALCRSPPRPSLGSSAQGKPEGRLKTFVGLGFKRAERRWVVARRGVSRLRLLGGSQGAEEGEGHPLGAARVEERLCVVLNCKEGARVCLIYQPWLRDLGAYRSSTSSCCLCVTAHTQSLSQFSG